MARIHFTQFVLEDASDAVVTAALASFRGALPAATAAPAAAPPSEPYDPAPNLSEDGRPVLPAVVEETVKSATAPAARRKTAPTTSGAAPAALPTEGTIPAQILAALAKKPMSSLELANFLKLESTQVYAPCSNLKQKGLIESRNDDAVDGTRRYFLVKK